MHFYDSVTVFERGTYTKKFGPEMQQLVRQNGPTRQTQTVVSDQSPAFAGRMSSDRKVAGLIFDREMTITDEPSRSVCAVMVTYHPSAHMLENMPDVLFQVQGMVAIDNGSNAEEVGRLRIIRDQYSFELIENRENLGIAEALNQGIRRARLNGHDWILLLDQDSTVTDRFVGEMFAAWEGHPERERIASIHQRYVDPLTGNEPAVRRANDGGPVVSLTSGALMPLWIFDKIGGFAEEYFIDCVDFEFCLRIRAAGYLVIDSPKARLLHSAGHAGRSRKFLWFRFRPTHYNARRRYYISRNRVALYRKYFRVFPGWVLRLMNDHLRETIKCFVGEPERAPKFRSLLLGTWDGMVGRMGKREIGSESR